MIKFNQTIWQMSDCMISKKYSKSVLNEEYKKYIEKALDEAEKELENPNTVFLTHEEVFEKLRNEINKK